MPQHYEEEPKWLVEIKRSRVRLGREEPFYAYLLYYLDIVNGDLYARYNGGEPPRIIDAAESPITKKDSRITYGVDNNHIYINPDNIPAEWFGTYNRNGKNACYVDTHLAHEAMHPAMLHNGRMGNRIPSIWNIACDAEINYQLEQDGFQWPPNQPHVPGDHRCAEAIYDEIIQLFEDEFNKMMKQRQGKGKGQGQQGKGQQGQKQGQNGDGKSRQGEANGQGQGESQNKQQGQGSGGGDQSQQQQQTGNSSGNGQQQQQEPADGNEGGFSPFEDFVIAKAQKMMANDFIPEPRQKDQQTTSEAEQAVSGSGEGVGQQGKTNWQEVVSQAIINAKAQGKMPGHLEEKLEQAASPMVNWKEIIKRRVRLLLRRKFNFERPNRRQRQDGIVIMAPTRKEARVCFVLDTSGSMGVAELSQGLAEIYAAFSSFKSLEMLILMVDAEVAQVCKHPNDIEIRGRGGTDFRPAFTYIKSLNHNEQPQILVYITDGYGSFPDKAPEYPVVWAMTTDIKPPFGDIVRVYRDS